MALYLVSKECADEYALMHHGIKGMKKGRRRWQNEDGSYTPEGRIHYGIGDGRAAQTSNEPDIDYKDGSKVSEYVRSVTTKYHSAARSPSVSKKINQDTATEYLNDNPKYNGLIDRITKQVQENNKVAVEASKAFEKSRETYKRPGPKFEAMTRATVKYWDSLNNSAENYIKKHFKGEEADIARALVYWQFIDW